MGNALARSLDEREISLEVARGVSQLIACDSVVVVHPDLERATVTPLVRLVGGVRARALPEAPLGDGVIARVARTGQPVLVAEPHPAASELIGADALVVGSGDAGRIAAGGAAARRVAARCRACRRERAARCVRR